ncbi:MAG: PDZ domain-containing protein [Anaerolineales bacterium]|nr:PDZ domain-containing protein [Anaerolineales bacterium]
MNSTAHISQRKYAVLPGLILIAVMLAACTTPAPIAASAESPETDSETENTSSESQTSGVIVSDVVSGSPAAEAGIERGDILLELNDTPVDSTRDVLAIIQGEEPGTTLTAVVLHGDEQRKLNIDVGEDDGGPYLGISICCGMESGIPARVGPGFQTGALVLEVLENGPAEAAGLQTGDLILSVDGEAVDESFNLSEIIQSMDPGSSVILEVSSQTGDTREVTVELGANPQENTQAYLGIRYRQLDSIREGGRLWMGSPSERFEYLPHFDRDLPLPWPGEIFQMPEELPEEAIYGVLLTEVEEESPAAEAGLAQGDVLVSICGKDVETQKDASREFLSYDPGDSITLEVYRSSLNETISFNVTLAENPEAEGEPYLGVQLGPSISLPSIEEGFWMDIEDSDRGDPLLNFPLNPNLIFDTMLQDTLAPEV